MNQLNVLSSGEGGLFQFFLDNQFLSGGFILLLMGGIIAYLRYLPGKIWSILERFLVIKIDIQDSDESYQWMCLWLARRLSDTLSVSVITRKKKVDGSIVLPHHKAETYDGEGSVETEERRPSIFLVPAVGTYFFWYKGRFVVCSRNRKEGNNSGNILQNNLQQLLARESLHLRIFSRNKALIQSLVEEARDIALPQDGMLDIRVARYSYWELVGRVLPRSLDSVILPNNIDQKILTDMQEFLNSSEWYHRLGIPYRRGYLFEGPPGGGKSSLVKALASALNMNIYLINLSDHTLDDNGLNQLFFAVAKHSIILIEDVDCAFVKRKTKNKGNGVTRSGLTFSGLLNAIDGIASGEGRIVIMTTNYKEKLDPALIRPGRVDFQVHIGNAIKEQARLLFLRFYPDNFSLAGKFVEKIEDGKYSMASLQGHLQAYKDNPLASIENIESICLGSGNDSTVQQSPV